MSDREVNDHLAYLSLGSNIQPDINLSKALELVGEKTQVLGCSNAWQTPAVGGHGPDFLNAVLLVRTDKTLRTLKSDVLEKIEAELGRVRLEDKYAPRTIDIDILIFDGDVIDHEIWTQAHLAVPLSEVYQGQIHSSRGETLGEISRRLSQINLLQPRPDILCSRLFT